MPPRCFREITQPSHGILLAIRARDTEVDIRLQKIGAAGQNPMYGTDQNPEINFTYYQWWHKVHNITKWAYPHTLLYKAVSEAS